ncbi:MAG: type II toxin-antitoxin system RelE/ParE family toxin [Planctomycetaceae bacterium]
MFEVRWLPDAEAELTSLWLTARDRQRITDAADRLDRQLRLDPESLGESRSPGRRVAFVSPIGIAFDVGKDDGKVVVVSVWRTR